jgi:hypothetical protein
MLVLRTAVRMPLRGAACTTGNKFSNVSSTMFRDNKLILLCFSSVGDQDARCMTREYCDGQSINAYLML